MTGQSLRTGRLPLCLAVLLGASLVHANSARAGGMFLTDHGTRTAGRGFAFVAGADDGNALLYNPAGLAFAGTSLFIDATLTLMDASYTRVDSGGNTLPTVDLAHPPLPIPMIAVTDNLGLRHWNFGAAITAPNLVQYEYPQGPEAPQRYSLLSLEGSVVGRVVIGASYQPFPELSIGISGELMVGTLRTRVALSACDGFVCSFQEDPSWDGVVELNSLVLTPTATVGGVFATGPVRIGASFSLPYSLGGSGTLDVRLPANAFFNGSYVEGDKVDVDLDMPWVARAGVEVRPVNALRLELAAVYEAWNTQEALVLNPDGITQKNITAIGDYAVGPVKVPRNMNDVISLRLGGEWQVAEAWVARAGVTYENSGFDDAYLSVLTLDSDKLVTSLGVGIKVTDDVWIDASYSHIFLRNRNVTDGAVPQATPIRPAPEDPAFVNNGRYDMEANMFGLGLRWQLSPPNTPAAPEEEQAPEVEKFASVGTHAGT